MQIRPEIYNPNMPYDYDPDLVGCKAFGLKRTNKVVYHPNACKTIADTVHLNNGKTVTFAKTYNKWGDMTEKLSYLRDSVGNWVRSKLQFYGENGEVVKTLKGRKKYDC